VAVADAAPAAGTEASRTDELTVVAAAAETQEEPPTTAAAAEAVVGEAQEEPEAPDVRSEDAEAEPASIRDG
jgi:hypothetical protein